MTAFHAIPYEEPSFYLDWATIWDQIKALDDWLYEDVLARGRGHALYAPTGTKKSLFTLWVAVTLATGNRPVVVVYLDFEMTEDDLLERLEDMGYGKDSDLSRLKYALLPSLPPLDAKEGAVAIAELIDEAEADHPGHHVFVVIDTFGRSVEGEENSADTFRRFYAATGFTLKQRGVTYLRLDHTGKDVAKGQRGSAAKSDDVDLVWQLRETENGIQLVAKKRRMGWVPERVTFALREDPLRFVPVEGDWPAGTEETATLLDRLAVPVDTSIRAAQKTLRDAGEGRRYEVILAALKWRKDTGIHPRIHFTDDEPDSLSDSPGESQ